ncbi:MAG: hypothetical protein AAF725_27895 [Acidobacteriota bacterium]
MENLEAGGTRPPLQLANLAGLLGLLALIAGVAEASSLRHSLGGRQPRRRFWRAASYGHHGRLPRRFRRRLPGATLRVFDRQAGEWRGYWIDGQRGRWSRPLSGRATATGMLLETSMATASPSGEAGEVDLQFEFYDVGQNIFHWRQNASLDGGTTWRRESTRMDCRRAE